MPEAEERVRHSAVKVPTFLLVVAGLVTLLGCSMSVAGAVTTGIFADDPAHVDRLTEFLHSGRYVIPDELDAVAPGATPDNAYVYGPLTTGLAHEINVLTGIERPGHVERTPDAYLVRHLVVAGMGLVGLAATAALGAIILGSWRWGVVVAGVLMAIPLWTGNAMFDSKDTPVAVGHTLATLGLVLVAGSSERTRTRRLIFGAIALMVGVVVTMGTRPGMWVSLAASMVAFAALVVWTRSFRRRALAAVGIALLMSYAALVAIYPLVFSHPLVMLWKSATASAEFPYDEKGRLYQIEQMVQIWPLILLSFLCVGFVVALDRAAGLLRDRSTAAVRWILVGTQAVTLPILIMVNDSNLANGLRQTLFVVPAQAVLVGVGFAAVIGATRSPGPRAWRIGGATVAVVGLILPTAVQLSMFPYQYSQMNVVGEFWVAGQEPSRYSADRDYWKTSYRELVPEVSSTVKVVCSPWLEKGEVPRRSEDDCRYRRGGTFSAYWRFDGKSSSDRPESDEFYAILRGALDVPSNCVTVHEVTRWQNTRRVTMSRLVRCHDSEH